MNVNETNNWVFGVLTFTDGPGAERVNPLGATIVLINTLYYLVKSLLWGTKCVYT